jgi:predicted O-methyltransferase YrrM
MFMADGNFENAVTKPKAASAAPSALLQIVPEFENIEGWLKLEDSELLFAAAASVRSGCIVELGSYRGRSTVALCAGSASRAKAPVYAIEPHEHFVGVKGSVFGPSDRRAFFKTMLTTRFANIVRLINATSQVVTPGWDKPVSLLFIDGDHRYDSVLSDFCAWRPHLVDGAIVIFYDANGAGTGLVIRDLEREGALTPVQTVGRLAMFCFNAVKSSLDPDEFEEADFAPVDPPWPDPVARPARRNQMVSAGTYYSARGNYLYRAIPKCACSTVKNALIELEGLPLDPNPTRRHNKKFNKFPGTEALSAAEEEALFAGRTRDFKFTMVRDPYARLASAYSDKIGGHYNGKRGTIWVDQIKQSAAAQGITLSEKITFEEFVRVVAGQTRHEMDVHWRQQYHIARFDLIKFDFVGCTETAALDLTYILERIKAPAEIMHRAIEPLNVTGSGLAMWSTVGAATRRAFLKTFQIDFDTLRYPVRHASVLFLPVNQDRPKPGPLALPKGEMRRKGLGMRRRGVVAAVTEPEPPAAPDIVEDVIMDDDHAGAE